MPAIIGILAPYLGKIIVGLSAIVAILIGYFSIKRKGALQERAKIEKQQEQAKKQVEAKIQVAVKKDDVIDAQVEKKIEEIKNETAKKDTKPDFTHIGPGDDYKFKF